MHPAPCILLRASCTVHPAPRILLRVSAILSALPRPCAYQSPSLRVSVPVPARISPGHVACSAERIRGAGAGTDTRTRRRAESGGHLRESPYRRLGHGYVRRWASSTGARSLPPNIPSPPPSLPSLGERARLVHAQQVTPSASTLSLSLPLSLSLSLSLLPARPVREGKPSSNAPGRPRAAAERTRGVLPPAAAASCALKRPPCPEHLSPPPPPPPLSLSTHPISSQLRFARSRGPLPRQSLRVLVLQDRLALWALASP